MRLPASGKFLGILSAQTKIWHGLLREGGWTVPAPERQQQQQKAFLLPLRRCQHRQLFPQEWQIEPPRSEAAYLKAAAAIPLGKMKKRL